MISDQNILKEVERYYGGKIEAHGSSPRGVDWNSVESQMLRFEQLLKIHDHDEFFTLNDYGCGYGALIEYLKNKRFTFQYRGLDISERMLIKARDLYSDLNYCTFYNNEAEIIPADYTVASGIFNVRLQNDTTTWQAYILDTLSRIDALSIKGFAFNLLTSYSDAERMRPDLYYADPLFLFDYCKRHFSRSVALLHDYPLYEFTILVKK
jgi:hypothetical protein